MTTIVEFPIDGVANGIIQELKTFGYNVEETEPNSEDVDRRFTVLDYDEDDDKIARQF